MLTITTDSFAGYGLDRAFALAAEAKLDGIEVSIRHEDYDTQDASYLKLLSERHKLPIVALSAPDKITVAKAENTIELAEKIGVSMVIVTPPDTLDLQYKKWLKNRMPEIRAKKKIHIAVINVATQSMLGLLPKYTLNSISDLKEFPDAALDTSNTADNTEPLIDIYNTLKKNLVHIHLSNARPEHDHVLLPDGTLPIESLLTRLARDKYERALSLKLNPRALSVGSTEKILGNIEACKKYVEKYFRAEV